MTVCLNEFRQTLAKIIVKIMSNGATIEANTKASLELLEKAYTSRLDLVQILENWAIEGAGVTP